MNEDAAIAVDAASGGDGARHREAGLRLRIVAAALGRGTDEETAALDRFLSSDEPEECLRLWFGPRATRRAVLTRDIAAIDVLLGDQIDAIIHRPEFKRLEASWRGVDLLLSETGNERRRGRIGHGPRPAANLDRVEALPQADAPEARPGLVIEVIVAAQAEEEVIQHVKVCLQPASSARLHQIQRRTRAA